LVSRQSFPHLWKKLWKIDQDRIGAANSGRKRAISGKNNGSAGDEIQSKVPVFL
jgi:hypothetical protein